MFELFTTTKYDNRVIIIDEKQFYTVKNLKEFVAAEMEKLEDCVQNVVILGSDNFSFIVNFIASIFLKKNIFLISDVKCLNLLDIEYEVLEDFNFIKKKEYSFPQIDTGSVFINFFTSGSSGIPKTIQKNLDNLLKEALDIASEFNFPGDLCFASTTSLCHLFGLTFHLMLPLCCKYKIYTPGINYPDNINIDNCFLVSSPTFLDSIKKHNISLCNPPKYIASAGSKLDDETFAYLENFSKVIEIYGSTETGVIAYKTDYKSCCLKLFSNVDIILKNQCTEVVSDYCFGGSAEIFDSIELNRSRQIKFNNRSDRLLKIYEKRVSAVNLENCLKENPLVKNCYVFQSGNKLACYCVLSEQGQDILLKNDIVFLIKNLKQHLKTYSEIIPQRWKFTDEIPMTRTGKVNTGLISHIFDINLSLPVVLDRKIGKDEILYELFFYKSCNFFDGHFPDFKIVPGVVQLFIAKEFANVHFNLKLGCGQWRKIKFSSIISPDSIVNLRLVRKDNRVSYEYYRQNTKYSSGVFSCENVFEEMVK